MTGIIYLPRSSRVSRSLTRRSLMLGAAGCLAASAGGDRTLAQHASHHQRTPEVSSLPGAAHERLLSLLALVPEDLPGGPDPRTRLFTWLDLQAHLAAFDAAEPFDDMTQVSSIMSSLTSEDPLIMFALAEEALLTFGFSVLDVHQTLVVGDVSDDVTFYAGGIPVQDLPEVWEAAGYKRKTGDIGDYWTIGEDGNPSLDTSAGRIGVGSLNNVAIINDDIVVFARTARKLHRVQEHIANGGESAADNDDLAALIESMPEDATNIIALPGSGLEAESITPENPGADQAQTTGDLLAESDAAVGPMPMIEMALFGVTAEVIGDEAGDGDEVPSVGSPEAPFFVHVLTGSDDEAAAAVEVAAWRVENMISPTTGVSYNERLIPEFSEADADQGNVAKLRFGFTSAPGFWHQMMALQDLWPFVWLEENL